MHIKQYHVEKCSSLLRERENSYLWRRQVERHKRKKSEKTRKETWEEAISLLLASRRFAEGLSKVPASQEALRLTLREMRVTLGSTVHMKNWSSHLRAPQVSPEDV
jgi:hypothetical protein